MSKEETIWEGNPSHWTSFPFYFISFLFIPLLGIGLIMGIWRYLTIRTWKIKITNQRIIEEKGVLSKTTNELELFRVKDLKLDQPFFLRLVGLSNIILMTSDRTNKRYLIEGVDNGKEIREKLRVSVEKRRDEKKVREVDFE